MSTRPSTGINFQVGTTAAIRSWAGEIEATLNLGWVQTSDTGQTAAASLGVPSGANASSGYQIWKMNDSLQTGSSTVFLKIEYGEGASTTVPSIWITIGTGSDGSGNITGTLLARTQVTPGGGTASTSMTSRGCANSSFIAMAMGTNAGRITFSIERTKDANGNDTTEGLYVMADANSAAAFSYKVIQELRFTNNTIANSTALGAFVPSGTSWADGSDFGVCPVRFFAGMPTNPCLAWMAYLNGDTAAGTSINLSVYGATHTYMPLGSTNFGTSITGNSNSSLMMRWE